MLISSMVETNMHTDGGLQLVTVGMRNVCVFCSVRLIARKAAYCGISVEFAVLSSRHCFIVTDTCAHTVMPTHWLTSLSADCVVRNLRERAT